MGKEPLRCWPQGKVQNMCIAAAYRTKDHYFGRNLDLSYSYHETVTVVPRNFPFHFRCMGEWKRHYAMIGMAYVVDDYPLFYDATNEKGLSIAGLNFPGNADYKEPAEGKDNVAPFELIPWILGQCAVAEDVKKLLDRMNLVNLDFREDLPLAPLHWLVSDREKSITVEAVAEGLKVYDNPVELLTNNPPFPYQMFHLNNYMGLSADAPENHFSDRLDLKSYSLGMGAMGLPGDLSSMSRFVKAAFVKLNSVSGDSEEESVSQFFHILGSLEVPRGSVRVGENEYEITVYTSCCNTDKGIYYYTTYENRQISGVDMFKENLEACGLIAFPLIRGQQIRMQNEKR